MVIIYVIGLLVALLLSILYVLVYQLVYVCFDKAKIDHFGITLIHPPPPLSTLLDSNCYHFLKNGYSCPIVG